MAASPGPNEWKSRALDTVPVSLIGVLTASKMMWSPMKPGISACIVATGDQKQKIPLSKK
jgi:hypothetical protein